MLELVAAPDHVVKHRPDRCANPVRGERLENGREYGRQRRQVAELPVPQPVVTEHRLISVRCAGCGQVTEPPGSCALLCVTQKILQVIEEGFT